MATGFSPSPRRMCHPLGHLSPAPCTGPQGDVALGVRPESPSDARGVLSRAVSGASLTRLSLACTGAALRCQPPAPAA